MFRRWAVPCCVICLLGCGRGEEVPPVYVVKGRVLKNGQPVRGGQIKFAGVQETAAILVRGTVGEDGSFTLATTRGKTTVSGAPAGTYQVLYQPPRAGTALKDPAKMRAFLPVTVSQNCKVEPHETGNAFTFDLAAVRN